MHRLCESNKGYFSISKFEFRITVPYDQILTTISEGNT